MCKSRGCQPEPDHHAQDCIGGCDCISKIKGSEEGEKEKVEREGSESARE